MLAVRRLRFEFARQPGHRLTALAAIALTCAGCASVAPGGFHSPFASREEKKILKLAEHDPFPSPDEVGLSKATSVP
jgi:hypothetical protein